MNIKKVRFDALYPKLAVPGIRGAGRVVGVGSDENVLIVFVEETPITHRELGDAPVFSNIIELERVPMSPRPGVRFVGAAMVSGALLYVYAQ